MGFCLTDALPPIAILKTAGLIAEGFGILPNCYRRLSRSKIEVSKEIDQHALGLYKRNLQTLLAILSLQRQKIIFLPQILVKEAVSTGKYQWWTPYIDQSVLSEHIKKYNMTTKETAQNGGDIYVDSIDETPWSKVDFVDSSHLNAEGNRKFAKLVSEEIIKLQSQP